MKQLTNNRLFVLLICAFALFAMASCTKADDRDQFEGYYLVDGTGSLTLHGVSQNLTSPIDISKEPMTLTKSTSNSAEMSVSGFFDQPATVIGNTIQFESFSTTSTTNDGVTIQAIYDVKKGTLNGSVLTFKIEISGNAYYQGSSVPISGTISCVATKQ